MASGPNLVASVVGAGAEPIVSGAIVAAAVAGIAALGVKALKATNDPLVPDEKLSFRNIGEFIALFVLRLGDMVMGKENRKYLPFVGTIFFYIFALNLLGLIPGMNMPTDSVTFNLGLGLVVFVCYNFWGIKEVGIVAYLKHLCGPIWWIAPLLFLVELIGHLVRPISLSLRLFGNMTGDHAVLENFTILTKFGIPVVFYGLGTFVCFMQAFVFTLLTMIYIRFAVAHDDDH